MNYHEVLGVSESAGAKEIKDAFRKAAKEIHPDISNSPEAAGAFARLKEAHDVLLKLADTSHESPADRVPAVRSSAATIHTVYSATDPVGQQIDAEEIARIQKLDEKALRKKKRFFQRSKESAEVKSHRKKLKTNERRLRGLY